MVDIEKLKQALINADAAGDTVAATRLVQAIRAGSAQAQSAAPQAPAAPQENYTGSILPFSRDETGTHFDSDAGILGSIKRAVTLPGDVFTGKVDPRSDEAIGRSLELAGIATPMTPAARLSKGPGVLEFGRQRKPKAPTAEALKTAAKGQYDDIANSGLEYSMSSVDDLSHSIQTELAQKGFGDELTPKTYKILQKLQNPPEGSVSVPFKNGIHPAVKQLGRVSAAIPEEGPASKLARDRILSFLERDGDQGILSGPSGAGVALKKANRNYASAKRSELLTGIDETADLKAAAANSGQNKGNAIRQRMAALLTAKGSARERSGFAPKEIAKLEKVVRGSLAANSSRYVGNMLGGGGGTAQTVVGSLSGIGGAAVGGLPGGVVGAGAALGTGKLAKVLSKKLTEKALRDVDKMTRERSPLFEAMLKAKPQQKLEIDSKDPLLRYFIEKQLQNPTGRKQDIPLGDGWL